MNAPQLNLLTEPMMYLAQLGGPSFFSTLVRRESGMKQGSYNVLDMPVVLRGLDPRRDSYISQATFRRPSRLVTNLKALGLCFADLDLPALREYHNEYGEAAVVEKILLTIDEHTIPQPSLIVSSGRGYHVKWLFESAVPWQALDRWQALEKTIVDRLHASLGADQKCKDASRVLRCVGTVNTKSGLVAKVLWENRIDGEVVRYPFDRLCDEVFGYLRRSHHLRAGDALDPRKERHRARLLVPLTYTQASLWWGRYRDIRKLCALRGWDGDRGVPEGYRDTVLFLAAVALSWYVPTGGDAWWRETLAVGRELTPTLTNGEQRQYVAPVWKRLKLAAAEAKLPASERQEHRYRYKTATIIGELEISAAEQEHLETLVVPELVRERKRANDRKRDELKRRAAGAEPREVYLGRAAERAQAARKLRDEGLTVREVAERLGISERGAYLALRGTLQSPSPCIVGGAPPPVVPSPPFNPLGEAR